MIQSCVLNSARRGAGHADLGDSRGSTRSVQADPPNLGGHTL